MSNRFGACRGSQTFGTLGPRPFGWGLADPLETRFLTTCVTVPKMVILGQTIQINGDMAEKNRPLASRLLRSLKVIGTDTDRSATYDFL